MQTMISAKAPLQDNLTTRGAEMETLREESVAPYIRNSIKTVKHQMVFNSADLTTFTSHAVYGVF